MREMTNGTTQIETQLTKRTGDTDLIGLKIIAYNGDKVIETLRMVDPNDFDSIQQAIQDFASTYVSQGELSTTITTQVQAETETLFNNTYKKPHFELDANGNLYVDMDYDDSNNGE